MASSRVSRVMENTGITLATIMLAALLSGRAIAATSGADDSIEAVWKTQHMNFEYRGYSTVYTCGGLRSTLRTILTSVGARDGIRLRSYGCDDQAGVARFQITLESPVAATEENIRELTTYSSEEELIARARGEHLASAQDLPRFPAVWKTVSFARDPKLRLAPGDCELVRQLRREILPRLSVQIVSDNLRCSAFGNISRPRLTVSALVAASDKAD